MAMSEAGGDLPEPVTGEAPGREAIEKHSDGWERAFDDALDKASKAWPKPSIFDVNVTYSARLSFSNPGTVDTYRAKLTPTGRG